MVNVDSIARFLHNIQAQLYHSGDCRKFDERKDGSNKSSNRKAHPLGHHSCTCGFTNLITEQNYRSLGIAAFRVVFPCDADIGLGPKRLNVQQCSYLGMAFDNGARFGITPDVFSRLINQVGYSSC